jgi:hypothetical protein
MSFADGSVDHFRGGVKAHYGQQLRYIDGRASHTVRYSFAAGAVTPATALVLTLVGSSDPIGSVNTVGPVVTWTPYDKSARYSIVVKLQTTTGNAAALAAGIYTTTGTVCVAAGEAGVTGVMSLTLHSDAVDFTTGNNVQVIPLVGAGVLGDPTATANNLVNYLQITKFSVE